MKNTVFPHKFWRPFLDCMPQLFFRPQYVWFPVHLKGHLIPLCYETLVVNWQNWLFTLFHQSRSVLSPNPIKWKFEETIIGKAVDIQYWFRKKWLNFADIVFKRASWGNVNLSYIVLLMAWPHALPTPCLNQSAWTNVCGTRLHYIHTAESLF